MITINLEAIGIFILKSLATIMAVALVVALPSAMIYDATYNEVAEKVATIALTVFFAGLLAVVALMVGCLLFEMWGVS